MKKTTFREIDFPKISEIIMQAALGVAAVTGRRLVISDLAHSLPDFYDKVWKNNGLKEPYYFAIREMGTESGALAVCLDRCKTLGYPIVIAKVESEKVCDFKMTITFTSHPDGNYDEMEKEFYAL